MQVASTVMRRSQSCEEQLQAVSVDPAICERIRSAASCVRRAVLDIDAKVYTRRVQPCFEVRLSAALRERSPRCSVQNVERIREGGEN